MRPLQKPGKINFGNRVDTSHCDTSHCARPVAMDECAGRRPAIETVAARSRRGAVANEGLKPRLSRCVAFAALPARCAALRGAARRRGAARSSCAAAGCWCPAPAPPPSRGRCAQQPRAAGALCPLRRRAATARPAARGQSHLPLLVRRWPRINECDQGAGTIM